MHCEWLFFMLMVYDIISNMIFGRVFVGLDTTPSMFGKCLVHA